MGDCDSQDKDDLILSEIKGLRADMASGVPIRPPSAKTILLTLAILAAVVPGGNAIASRVLAALAGAPVVTVEPEGEHP